MRRRFRRLRQAVREFIDELDVFGLKDRKSFITTLAPARRQFEFLTDPDKLEAFNTWFKQQVDAGILAPDPNLPISRPWVTKYVESAYRQGLINAHIAAKKSRMFDEIGEMTREEFIRSAFAQPETFSKVRLLGTRSFEQLKGITATMGAEMNRILAQGIADGRGAEEMARQLTKGVDGITRQRALVLARTEVIHAHAEGQLDAFEDLKIEELEIKAEWSTAGDDRVCPLCAKREGKIYSIRQARGLIPLHPNCRCAWIPIEVEKKKRRKRRR